jgi:hypothetical protein
MLAALREKTEKLSPPGTSVAPMGKQRPVAGAVSGFIIAIAMSSTSATGAVLFLQPPAC